MAYTQRRIPVSLEQLVQRITSDTRERIAARDRRRFEQSPEGKVLAALIEERRVAEKQWEARKDALESKIHAQRAKLGIPGYWAADMMLPDRYISRDAYADVALAERRFAEAAICGGKEHIAQALHRLKETLVKLAF